MLLNLEDKYRKCETYLYVALSLGLDLYQDNFWYKPYFQLLHIELQLQHHQFQLMQQCPY